MNDESHREPTDPLLSSSPDEGEAETPARVGEELDSSQPSEGEAETPLRVGEELDSSQPSEGEAETPLRVGEELDSSQPSEAEAVPVPEEHVAQLTDVTVGPLEGVNLTLIDREITALVGPAGAGKSLLLQSLIGLERTRSGIVEVAGLRLPREARKVRALVGYVGPNPTFYPSQDATSLGRFLSGIHRRWVTPKYLATLEAMGIERDRRLNDLPLDQRLRVSLAAAFTQQPRLVLVDVPDALGEWGRELLLAAIEQLHTDQAVVIADSRLHGLQDLATRVAILAQGRVRYTGPVSSLLGQLRAYTLAEPTSVPQLPDGLTALHRRGTTLYARGESPDPLPPGLLSVRSLDLAEAYVAAVGEVVPGPRSRSKASK